MKTLISLIAVTVFSCGAIATTTDGTDSTNEKAVSILETTTLRPVQEEQTPPPPAPAVDQAVAPEPAVAPQPAYIEQQSVIAPEIEFATPVLVNETTYMPSVASSYCPSCCDTPCCCPALPTSTTFCLVDPCGCSHEACVEVPACCAGQNPTVTWRGGLFGRQVATLCWDCCGHEVKVVVARSGKVRVRG